MNLEKLLVSSVSLNEKKGGKREGGREGEMKRAEWKDGGDVAL